MSGKVAAVLPVNIRKRTGPLESGTRPSKESPGLLQNTSGVAVQPSKILMFCADVPVAKYKALAIKKIFSSLKYAF